MLRRGAIAVLVVVSACALPSAAAAEPVSFAHGTIDNLLTTAQPGAPTGSSFKGTYHALADGGVYDKLAEFQNRHG